MWVAQRTWGQRWESSLQEPGSASVFSAWPGPRSLLLGRRARMRSAGFPGGLQGAFKNTQVVRSRAKTHSWKLRTAQGPEPKSSGSGDSPVSRLILKPGFPGDAFALSLRKGWSKEPHVVHESLWLTLKTPERWGASLVAGRCPSQLPSTLQPQEWGHLRFCYVALEGRLGAIHGLPWPHRPTFPFPWP